MELDLPCYAARRLPNGNWLLCAPTGDPVGPRVAVLPRPRRRERLVSSYGAARMYGSADVLFGVNRCRCQKQCFVAVDPKAAVRRSIPKALSILASIDIAAVWVQAIERRARNEVADVLDKPVAPARRWYHAISHAPGPRTQWRIRPHRPDQSLIGDSYS